jgi:hypothetical protein
MDIVGFVSALLGDWIGLMSSGVSVLLTVLGFFQKTAAVRRAFWFAGIACVLIACAKIWTVEHRSYLSEVHSFEDEKKLYEGLALPRLSGEIVTIAIHALNNSTTGVLVAVRITNTGADSVAYDYQLAALVNGTPRVAALHMIPTTLPLSLPTGKAVYHGRDAIYEKTEPIKRGGQIIGILWGWFENVQTEWITPSAVSVAFVDINGVQYTAKVANPRSSHPVHVPGLH